MVQGTSYVGRDGKPSKTETMYFPSTRSKYEDADTSVFAVSATFDVGRDDGPGSRRNVLGVTLYEDLCVNKLVFLFRYCSFCQEIQ